jgi:hypothetical protein
VTWVRGVVRARRGMMVRMIQREARRTRAAQQLVGSRRTRRRRGRAQQSR